MFCEKSTECIEKEGLSVLAHAKECVRVSIERRWLWESNAETQSALRRRREDSDVGWIEAK